MRTAGSALPAAVISAPVVSESKRGPAETRRCCRPRSSPGRSHRPRGSPSSTPSPAYTASGNLQSVTDPLGNTTTHTYNANGTLQATTLPTNGDGITRTTSYESYDPNGLPTQVRDAAGNRAKAAYGADGRPLWVQDPIHSSEAGADTRSYRRVFDYDGYGRLIRSSSPKSSTWARGLLVWAESGYDANDNPVRRVAPYYALAGGGYGSVTASSFDAMDRVVSVVGPDSSSGGPEETQTVYDDAGRVVKTIAPKGVATAATDDYAVVMSYDLLDRPVSETRYQLDGGGQIDTAKTRTSVFCYDAAGDLRSLTGPKGASGLTCPSATVWPYTPTGQAYTTRFGYDPAHRRTSVSDPLGRTTQTEYDANGWVSRVVDPLGQETSFEYSQRGEQAKVVQPFEVGRTLISISEYDALGNVRREISPRAYDTSPGGPYSQYVSGFAYDALGRLVRTALPKASAETQTYTHSAYDANGRLVWTSLPSDRADAGSVAAADKTVNEYWDTGGLYSTTVGGSAKVRFDYTAEGWQGWRLPETAEGTGVADYGRMMFWEYFPDGLLRAERDLAGRRSSYVYDANGNRTSAAEAQSIAGDTLTVESSFDGFDELEAVRTPKLGSGNYWASVFSYDQHGNVASLEENREETSGGATVTAGRVFGFSYDGADQPLEQTDDFGSAGVDTDDERFSFSFDDAGRLSQRTIEKDTGASWATEQIQQSSYYFNGLLKTLVTKDGQGSPVTVASHSLSYIAGGVYVNGNRTQDVFRVKGPDGSAPCGDADCTASWDYDGRERLIREVSGTGTTSEFTLDPQGNVTLEKRNGTIYRTAAYSGQRLSTTTEGSTSLKYLYDAYGNVDCVVLASWVSPTCPAAATGQAVAAELVTDNVYDYRDRLVAVRAYSSGAAGDKSEYRYDPLARPVRKTATENGATTTTDMIYLGVSNALVRETEAGAATKERSYAFDALGDRATLSETVTGVTSRYSYVQDALGSVELLLDQANTVKAAYGYLAYGEANPALTKTAAGFDGSTNAYRYTGKRWDPAAQAYDLGARHYLPALGRWFQQDLYTDALANLALSTDPLTQKGGSLGFFSDSDSYDSYAIRTASGESVV